ncbi:MAG: hypothetical protein LBT44_01355 [Clostridiales bacterium]|jgi:hypothetical protein|nr:hypothetical protein [Clostridiales bacterium]
MKALNAQITKMLLMGTAALTALWAVFFMASLRGDVRNLLDARSDMSRLRRVLAGRQAQQLSLEAQEQLLPDLAAAYWELSHKFLSEAAAAAALSHVRDLAEKRHIAVKTFQTHNIERVPMETENFSGGRVLRWESELTGEGAYSDALHFLTEMSGDETIHSLTAWEMVNNAEAEGSVTFRVNFFFYSYQEPDIGDADETA